MRLTSKTGMGGASRARARKGWRHGKLAVNEPLQIACYDFENRIGRSSLKKDSSGLPSEFAFFPRADSDSI